MSSILIDYLFFLAFLMLFFATANLVCWIVKKLRASKENHHLFIPKDKKIY